MIRILLLAASCAALLSTFVSTFAKAQEAMPGAVPGVDFAKSVFDEAGVPYSLAPWLKAMRTEGVPFFDPPRPLPKPTKGGELSRNFGLPVWNGLIGGVDGVPNTGLAPRGTLLWCKQEKGNEAVFSISLSQGPERTITRPSFDR